MHYLDGGKIVCEKKKISGYNDGRLYYEYDESGIAYITSNMNPANLDAKFAAEKDLQGNVVKLVILNSGPVKTVAEYEYDAFGNPTVTPTSYTCAGSTISASSENHIANLNPFLWKGHYWDKETELYEIGGNYYDPLLGRFVSPVNIEQSMLTGESPYAMINPTTFPPNAQSFDSCLPLVSEGKDPTWWQRALKWYNDLPWGWKVGVGAGLFLAGLGLTGLTGGAALPFIAKFGIGVAAGTAIGTGINLATGAEFGDALLDGFADSVLFSGVFAFGSGAIRAGKYGYAYATKNAEIMAKLFTHNKYAASYMLGQWDGGGAKGYIAQAKAGGHTYFAMPKRIYTSVNVRFTEGAWSINRAFLTQQAGKVLFTSHSIEMAVNTFLRELIFLGLR